MIKINKGLDLPIAGAPGQTIQDGPKVRTVALLGQDYIGMKPTMMVKVGDRVKLGQVIFTDKKTEGVQYTAPGAGTVCAINRGERRVLQSVVIELDDQEDAVEFASYPAAKLDTLSREQIEENLLASGLWAAFRTRPFSRVPQVGTTPSSIFVTAIDTNPLAADPALIINEQAEDFVNGLKLLARMGSRQVYLCKAAGVQVPTAEGVQVEEFAGKHPAGNPSTHVHFLDPVSREKTAWIIGYQDVIAFGKLFVSGRLPTERVVALAGPQVEAPSLVRTRVGVATEELCAGKLKSGKNRVINGSVWNGRSAIGPTGFLGRYANQVSVLLEGDNRDFMGWITPGANKFSVLNMFASVFSPSKKFDFTTTTNGSERAMIPVGQFEALMPLDILPTQLLRALVTGDIVTAMQLGCLELDEEDLALCTFACPGKYEYGPILRDNLTRIEKEA
ncbi:Na(+)-translocating NADH-quinone reductase subunit A [Marinobacterium marinum]|uniref:Na(+)-translocating NADH-quinone reductase subunit A n=1 Tax=Marinobacterium marinum TaxID=2756129 RepID=A0A7W2ABY9_9GAMM|nr:Na(+)-translocating NADH-quinone reductase subunit A [Marinobacterium marinum]MBA4501972.1 Na(+)-translocating NADH-quinone reductase subunit A [Marinobacterium marinum]